MLFCELSVITLYYLNFGSAALWSSASIASAAALSGLRGRPGSAGSSGSGGGRNPLQPVDSVYRPTFASLTNCNAVFVSGFF